MTKSKCNVGSPDVKESSVGLTACQDIADSNRNAGGREYLIIQVSGEWKAGTSIHKLCMNTILSTDSSSWNINQKSVRKNV